MNNMRKRIIAAVLCVALVLPVVPLQPVLASNDTTSQPVEIQAENTEYTNVYKYNNIGPTHVGGANESAKSTWPTYDELAQRTYFDKSNVPYIAFYVDAPEDGTYSMAVAYQYGSAKDMQHYATLVVNGGGAGNVYKALRSDSGVRGGDATTQSVNVTLKKGINTVYCVVLTKDQLNGNDGWANVEKFVVDGRLTPVKNNAVTLQATNATYLNKWNRTDGYINNSDTGAASNEKLSVADLNTAANLAKVPFVSYTVYAQKAGYYDITVDVAAGTLQQDPDAVGLVVDGVAYAKKFFKHSGSSNSSRKTHFADISVWLEAGTHTLTVTMMLPSNAQEAQTHTYCWTDISEITLHGGLVASDIQINPVTGEQSVEAASSQYVVANRYTAGTTSNRNFFGYAYLGSGNPANNQTLADIRANGLNVKNNAMATIFVYAPADGTYSFGARGEVKIPGLWSNNGWSETPYFTFVANEGKDPYKANFTGQNGWVSNTNTVEISLKQGVNAICCVPLVKDLITGSDYWCNLDCIFVDSDLTVLTAMDIDTYDRTIVKALDGSGQVSKYVTINRLTNLKQTSNSAYTDNKYIIGGVNAGNSYWPNTDTLGNHIDRSNASMIAYYVDAPEAGEYRIGMHLQMYMADANMSDVFTTVIVNDGGVNNSGVYEVPFLATNGSWTNSFTNVTLNKGRNVIYIVLMNGKFSQSRDDWANFDCLILDKRLTPVEAKDTVVNTGSSSYITGYKNVGINVGGGVRPSTAVSIDTLKPEQINDKVNSVSFTVNAPKDGYYDIFVGFGFGSGVENGAVAYIIDGVAQAREYSYMGNIAGNHGSNENYLDLGAYLTAGEHVITITCPLKRTASDTITLTDWCDLRSLHLTGGLTLSGIQKDPGVIIGKNPSEPEQETKKYVYVEAEDQTYTQWFHYSTAWDNGNCSGGKYVGGGNPANNPTLAALKANPGMDLSAAAGFKIIVNAPAAGDYCIIPRYMIRDKEIDAGSEMNPDPYVVIVANGTVYTAANTSKNDWFSNCEGVYVNLEAGDNEIFIIPLIKDLMDAGYDYANYDCTILDERLKAVKRDIPVFDRIEAEDRTNVEWNKYSSIGANPNASNGYFIQDAWYLDNVDISELKNGVDLSETAYIMLKVTVPADGEYTVYARYSFRTKAQNTSTEFTGGKPYLTFFVNGTAYKATNNSKNDWIADTDQVKIKLNKGENTIYVIPLTADQEAKFAPNGEDCWANLDCVYIDSRLTPVKTGYVAPPDNSGRPRVEAEDTIYTEWNSYHTTEKGNGYSNGLVVAGSHAGNNVYLSELVPGVDLINTAYLKWTFVAPKAGNYKFAVRFNLKASNLENNQDLTPEGYATFWVNDSKAYTASLTGSGAKNGWVSDSQDVEIWLEAGENTIVLIPMVRDLYKAYGTGWSNVDCLYYDDALTLKKAPVYTRINAVNSEHFGYIPESGRLMREDYGSAFTNNMTFENLTIENVNNVSWVKYTVQAQAAGVYRIGIGFDEGGSLESGKVYTAMSVNGGSFVKVYFNHTVDVRRQQLIYMDIELHEGENTILITSALAEYFTEKGVAQLYIDQTHLMLPEGVYGFITDGVPTWTGDDQANINDSLGSVWGDTSGYVPNGGNASNEETKPSEPGDFLDPTVDPDTDDNGGSGLIWLWVLIVAAVVGGTGYVIYWHTKKKKTAEEAE